MLLVHEAETSGVVAIKLRQDPMSFFTRSVGSEPRDLATVFDRVEPADIGDQEPEVAR